MTIVLDSPAVITEIEELMARFNLSANDVVERVILEAGTWMPMELLAYPPSRFGEPAPGEI
jgi:aromatic ring-opening dioxygenase catalytic subunit (LigB family)